MDSKERSRDLFLRAADLPPHERRAFLEGECGHDLDLLSDVLSLLEYDAGPVQLDGPADLVGQVIGPYTICQLLGEGGMGEVYRAEQQAPLQRQVALKVIKLGMDTREVIARFNAERQSLAILEHPGIAHVYEAGSTTNGRPYFVMEYVVGLPITEYCDRERLTVRQRLRLFSSVCQAVHHAHQKGIVHRDIKPSNVLVTRHDAEPIPKIIDFGVAKTLDQGLRSGSVRTVLGKIIGTPEYMSPEQAIGRHIDTSTDVYSLGVLLYELLTGVLPFDAEQLRAAGAVEMQRILQNVPAPRPSSRIAAGAANKRSAEAESLTKQLQADLDWIVLRAIEKEPAARYGSASELSADVERFLANEAVVARPPTLFYQAGKLISRHKLPVAFASIIVLLLVGFGVAMTVLYGRAETARRDAEAMTSFYADLWAPADAYERGQKLTIEEVMRLAANKIPLEFRERPGLASSLRESMGNVFTSLGFYADAESVLTAVLRERRALYGPEHPSLIEPTAALARVHLEKSEYGRARDLYRDALALHERHHGSDDPGAIQITGNLAYALKSLGKLAEARALLEDAVHELEAQYGTDHALLGPILSHLATVTRAEGKHDEAIALGKRALVLQERDLGSDHPKVAAILSNLGLAEHDAKNYEQARTLHTRALAIRERVFGRKHRYTAQSLNNLANAVSDLGDNATARQHYEEVLEIYEATVGTEHVNVAEALGNLADINLQDDRFEEAREYCLRSLALFEKLLGPEHQSVGMSLVNLGSICCEQSDFEEGRRHYQRAAAIFEKSLPADHPYQAIVRDALARLAPIAKR